MYDSFNNECVFAASHITIQCGKRVVGKSKVGKRTLNFKISSYDESTRRRVKKRHRSGGTLGSSQSVQQAVVGADIRAVHVHYNNVYSLFCYVAVFRSCSSFHNYCIRRDTLFLVRSRFHEALRLTKAGLSD